MNRIKIYIAAAFVAFSAVSCLDKMPEGEIPAESAIRTIDDANQQVIGIYADFKSAALYSGYLTLLPDIQADLVHAVEGYSNTYGDFWRWDFLPTSSEIEAVYGTLYGIIGDCNFLLDYEDRLKETVVTDADDENLQELLGEAHFARAIAYSELIKLFCEAYDPARADEQLGVVLVTSYHNPGKFTRASLKDSYQLVLDDLAYAHENILYDKVFNTVYFTKSAANALTARVYLYMQNWEKAVEYSTKVIDDEYLSLSSVNAIYGGTGESFYQYMWSGDAATEIIWKVGFTTTSYGGALGRVFSNYDYISYKPDYVPSKWVLDLYSGTDARYNCFFKEITTGYAHRLSWPLLVKYPGNPTFSQVGILSVNMPKVFRLSEQYLIRAEAYCRLGKYSKAATDLTTLRNARFTSGSSISIGENNWLQTISDERVRELYMEGFRLQDLKRWGKGFERVAQTNTVTTGNKLKISSDNPMFVWPIPQHEINSAGSDIQPNESNK